MPQVSKYYNKINELGSNTPSDLDHPMSYCLGSTLEHRFNHGPSSDAFAGQDSRACQLYMADYCADNFDGLCAIAASNSDVNYPSHIRSHTSPLDDRIAGAASRLSQGEIVIRNSAIRKYMSTGTSQCVMRVEAFDPTRANSPLVRDIITTDGGEGCQIQYTLTDAQIKAIDTDPVMMLLLDNPRIAPDVLASIYESLSQSGRVKLLSGTRLGLEFQKLK